MIVNLQRKVKLNAPAFMPYLVAVRAGVEEVRCCHFSVALVSDRRMQELNSMFRGKDATTDVLSFPHEKEDFENIHHTYSPDEETPEQEHNFLGDIVISAEQAARQADENGLSLECEIKQLILHGVLHLAGMDHETDNGQMNSRELELRSKLGIEG